MCFDKTTSLTTFTVSLLCSAYLLYNGITTKNKNDIFLGILTILVGFIQLIEYILWNNQECNKTNHYASLAIIVVLFLQGIILNIVYFYLFPHKKYPYKIKQNIIIFFGLLYTLFIIYSISWLNKTQLCSQPSSKSERLTWAPFKEFNKNKILSMLFSFFYFLMAWFIFINCFYSNMDMLTKYPLRYSILLITFIIALIYTCISETTKGERWLSYINVYNHSNVFGSMWCFLSVVVGIIGVLHL